MICAVNIMHRNDLVELDLTEMSNLLNDGGVQLLRATTCNLKTKSQSIFRRWLRWRVAHQIRTQSDFSDPLYGLLRWFRLLLCPKHGHMRDMDLQEIPPASFSSKRSHGLDEGTAFYIADRASKLDDAYIWLLLCVIDWYPRNPFDPITNSIREMRDDLDRFAEVIATSLSFNDMMIYLAGRDVVFSSQFDTEISFVVAQVQIGFSTVVKDKYFAVSE